MLVDVISFFSKAKQMLYI